MKRYDYENAVREDVLEWITEHYSNDEITEKLQERGDWEQELNDDMWTADSVTGNGSGSYTFNAWEAEENVCHNLDLLGEALQEFGSDMDIMKSGAEACDVTIRCYLLGGAISAALDELEEEREEEEET